MCLLTTLMKTWFSGAANLWQTVLREHSRPSSECDPLLVLPTKLQLTSAVTLGNNGPVCFPRALCPFFFLAYPILPSQIWVAFLAGVLCFLAIPFCGFRSLSVWDGFDFFRQTPSLRITAWLPCKRGGLSFLSCSFWTRDIMCKSLVQAHNSTLSSFTPLAK